MIEGGTARKTFMHIAWYLALGVVGLTMLTPFFWMISTSLKRPEEVMTYPPTWLPCEYYVDLAGEAVEVTVVGRRFELRLPSGGELDVPVRSVRRRAFAQPRLIDPETGFETPVRIIGGLADVRVIEPGLHKGKRFTSPASDLHWRFAPVWGNYTRACRAVPFFRGYINSLTVALAITIGQVVTSSMAAFAFARLSFPGRDKLFMAYLATMMIPVAVTMIPVFILLKQMPLVLNDLFHTDFWTRELWLGRFLIGRAVGVDSYFGLIAPALFTAYGTFLLRQFFMGIPRDLEDAARIDGSGYFGIYRRIILPLSKPAIATLTIFTFMAAWKNFLWPLVITESDDMQVLSVMLASLQTKYTTDWTALMAGSVIQLVPMLIVFVIGQRYFIEGIKLGAVKG